MEFHEIVKRSKSLNNSNKFDFYLFLDYESFESLYLKFCKKTKLRRISDKKYKNNFSVLMANLIKTSQNNKYLALSFSKTYYIISEDYNPKKIRWDIISNIIDFLKKENFIEINIGYKKHNFSRLTRIKLKEDALKLFKNVVVKTDFKNYSYIVLKDEDKNYSEFKRTPLIKRREKVVKDFNLLLSKNYVTINNKIIETNPMYRVFNNNSLKQGGRFYGGEFQRISKEDRKKIKINGKETVELDFSCLHINLLYDKEKIKYKDDAYEIGYKREHSRKIIKFILITMLNSSSKKDAISAVRYHLNRNGNKSAVNIEKVVDLLLEKHEKIKKYFFKKKNGLSLQYQESLVAEHIIKNFIYGKDPKVILPIHDGFICEKRYEKKLEIIMKQAYKKFIGGKNCKITKV